MSLDSTDSTEDLVRRILSRRPGGHSAAFGSTSTGGFVPHSRYRKPVAPEPVYQSHWISKNTVGLPERTAWTINDRGNRVWFKYESSPSMFPVKETRFYKPKLHKTDFLGKKKKDGSRDI